MRCRDLKYGSDRAGCGPSGSGGMLCIRRAAYRRTLQEGRCDHGDPPIISLRGDSPRCDSVTWCRSGPRRARRPRRHDGSAWLRRCRGSLLRFPRTPRIGTLHGHHRRRRPCPGPVPYGRKRDHRLARALAGSEVRGREEPRNSVHGQPAVALSRFPRDATATRRALRLRPDRSRSCLGTDRRDGWRAGSSPCP